MQVLLLTDFSPNAKIMQDYALNFFGDVNVHFILMHALKPCKSMACKGSCNSIREQKLETNFQELKKELKQGQSLSKVFIKNNLVDAVRNYIDKSHVDMIFMGGKGRTSDVNKQFGKNTYDIVTKIRCPILVVFENSVVKIPGKIIFPLDYTTTVKKNYFNSISQLNFWKNVDLSILEVPNRMFNSVLSQKINKQKITKAFKELDYHFTSFNPADKIGLCDNCKNADMIMFMAKNLNISNRIFNELGDNNLNPHMPLLVLHG